MRRAFLFLATVLCVEGQIISAQDKTADQGVYTSAQAARGATVFEAHCVSCHREGGTAPVMAGARFTKSFADATLLSVFTTIQTTMPRNAPNSLAEAEYVDVVAHLLKLNGYPDGMTELALAGLGDIKVPGQGGSLDFTLVHVVGCLAQAGRAWTLGKATDPVRTRAPEARDRRGSRRTRSGGARNPVVSTSAGLWRPGRLDRPEGGSKGLFDPGRRRGTRERHLDEGALDALPELI